MLKGAMTNDSDDTAAWRRMLAEMRARSGAGVGSLRVTGRGGLESVFAVTDLAVASMGAAGLAAAELAERIDGRPRQVGIDRALASRWFGMTLRPQGGWSLPPLWDAIAGDYRTADGWIRLHTNAPRHRAAALQVLGVPEDRAAVAEAVACWQGADLEAAVVAAGGCAAVMHTMAEWAASGPGRAVAEQELLHFEEREKGAATMNLVDAAQPLRRVRVLDLTRVLAGPVATRFLAGLGAEVLRIDPPDWQEPGVEMEVMPGKRGARLDLREAAGRQRFGELLAGADVLMHGYRPGALEGLGLGEDARRGLRPGLIEVTLCAYGWSGPWRQRRGFDSLVQMSCGIAAEGMQRLSRDRPTPLPVQALDQATGYLMAAAALDAVKHRLATGRGSSTRASLARTALMLMERPQEAPEEPLPPETEADLMEHQEATAWGPARRLRLPLIMDGVSFQWNRPAMPLGSDAAEWNE
jgi:crotonobetainyl-CoA:carnitine CoA-transferase CaiB-like acyl-CoA transferase